MPRLMPRLVAVLAVASGLMAAHAQGGVGPQAPPPQGTFTLESHPGKEVAGSCPSIDACDASCRAGEAESCSWLGNLLFWSPVRDRPRMVDAYERACRLGDRAGCLALGVFYETEAPAGSLPGLALGYYEDACDRGSTSGCEAVARLLRPGAVDGGAPDLVRAAALFTKGCDLEVAEACASLSVCYLHGIGVEADASRARELIERGCDFGSPVACDTLARSLYFGTAGRNPARAAELFTRACVAHVPGSCLTLAELLRDVPEPLRNVTRAAELFEQLCAAPTDDEDPVVRFRARPHFYGGQACLDLAELYREGNAVPRDPGRAVSLFDRACQEDFSQGCCSALALRTELGELKPKTPTQGQREDDVRLALLRSVAGSRRPTTICVALHPCFEPLSPYLVSRLKEESITVDCVGRPAFEVHQAEWAGQKEAQVRAGELSQQGLYVLRRNLFGTWRIVRWPIFE